MADIAANFGPNFNASSSNVYQAQSTTYFNPLNDKETERHKGAIIIHLFFKVSSIVLYILSGLIFGSFVFPFVIILILVSFDFWVVKNITGRYLLGLRWWNRTDDGDNEVWVFEYKDTHFVSPVDSNMFWMSSYIVLSIWIFLALISIIRLNFGWSIICLVAIGMGLINLTAYSKCDKYAKSQLQKGTRDDLAGFGFLSNLIPNNLLGFSIKSWFK